LVLTTGCRGDKEPKDSVSGKVTMGGQAVAGVVNFVYPDGKKVASPLGADGSYKFFSPPVGQVKVVVEGMPGVVAPPPMKGGPELPKMPGASGVAPPAKYGSANTTDLTYEVKAGAHVHNIDLK